MTSLGTTLSANLSAAAGEMFAAPDQLIDRAGAAVVIRAGQLAIEDREIKRVHLCIGRHAVAEE